MLDQLVLACSIHERMFEKNGLVERMWVLESKKRNLL